MNAKDAREKVEKLNSMQADKLKLQQEIQYEDQVNHLYKHFKNKIDEEVQARKFSVETTLGENMYNNEIVTDVVNKLKKDGYQVQKETHNAFKTVKFIISWV